MNLEAIKLFVTREMHISARGRFSTRLRTAMNKHNMTPAMLAVKVGANRTTVYNWVAGRRFPEPQFYKPLCKALKTSHADLLLD